MWDKESIRKLLQTNHQAVLRAIIVLYNRQTELEKEFKESNINNGIGFTCKDSWFLSNLAMQLIKYKKISKNDYWRARWRVFKYAGQLADIANKKEKDKENVAQKYIQQIKKDLKILEKTIYKN